MNSVATTKNALNNRTEKKAFLALEKGNKNAINDTPIKITSCHIHNRCENLSTHFASLTLAHIAQSFTHFMPEYINAIIACTCVCDYAIKLID